jgi:hypothetical protein
VCGKEWAKPSVVTSKISVTIIWARLLYGLSISIVGGGLGRRCFKGGCSGGRSGSHKLHA